ncbi:hypothetical protein [Streptomyces mutabilis]|uniref:DNA primase/polymerase bifunctional N-terminal domain-containing protein n=1 Tax=Streptomyces mutabilis TaxID=67332 RepID=A0A086N0Y9_9ACTN|nr:hypothetical protein [Streptomyces mutabilis]KFG74807.1 hypothetical protein FM21_01185 [Streptomyces mutabilis]
MTETMHRPSWVPLAGHRPHVAGVHFDAVRIDGIRGELVADWLVEASGDDAGPIVCEAGGGRWVYFLLAPGEVAAYDWPLGVQRHGGGTRTVTYVGVPALEGNTWPLRWYSVPTATAPYVCAALLRAALTTDG